MNSKSAKAMGRAVVKWFEQHGRADWPWRGPYPRDAYRVWISEIMLQQTVLKAVAPRFEQWLKKFPDVSSLARAGEEDVLREWEGLGYYARARNLHRAAREIVARHGGRIPDDPAALRALPGIGAYTAAAIGSLAFGRPEPVLDANVRRVARRLLGMVEWNRAAEKKLEAFLRDAIPPRAPGAFNEGLMEIGQTLCLAADPLCERCPLARRCAARAAGTQNKIPGRRSARITRRATALLALVDERDHLLIIQRPDGLLKDLWVLPGLPHGGGEDTADYAAWIKAHAARRATLLGALPERTHAYTRFSERLTPEVWRVVQPRPRPLPHARWVPLAALERYPFPSVYRRIIRDLIAFLAARARQPELFE